MFFKYHFSLKKNQCFSKKWLIMSLEQEMFMINQEESIMPENKETVKDC